MMDGSNKWGDGEAYVGEPLTVGQRLEAERLRQEDIARHRRNVERAFDELPKLVVLSLDGGGVRGLLQAHLLKHLEDAVQSRIGRPFRFERETWLAAGTSTGGIIAAALATPTGEMSRAARRSEALITLYETLSWRVFARKGWTAKARHLVRPKHDARPLEHHLRDQLGDARLLEARPRLLIPSYSAEHHRVWWFDSRGAAARHESPWRYEGWTDPEPALENPSLVDVCLATSAAPTYFEAHSLEDPRHGRWIDGGVGANNPTLAAMQVALGELHRQRDLPGSERRLAIDLNPRILVLSIGSGGMPPRAPIHAGLAQWMFQIPRLFGHSSGTAAEALAEEVAKTVELSSNDRWLPVMTYCRLAPAPGEVVVELDDPGAADLLEKVARRTSHSRDFDLAVRALAAFVV